MGINSGTSGENKVHPNAGEVTVFNKKWGKDDRIHHENLDKISEACHDRTYVSKISRHDPYRNPKQSRSSDILRTY